jgi:hypothetical protein
MYQAPTYQVLIILATSSPSGPSLLVVFILVTVITLPE